MWLPGVDASGMPTCHDSNITGGQFDCQAVYEHKGAVLPLFSKLLILLE